MATDITTLLIQMIKGGTPTDGLAVNGSVLGSAADLLSTTANYAQILGTAAPAAQAAIAGLLSTIIEGTGGAAAEAATISSATVSPVFGAVVVLILSFIAAVLAAAGNSSGSQQFVDLNDAVKVGIADALATYWDDKLTGSLSLLWSAVGKHLDDLKREGTVGVDVRNHVSDFHDDAVAFVNQLVTNPFGSDQYWQVPPQPAGDVPQSSDVWKPDASGMASWWTYGSWYGRFPTRPTVAGSPSGNVLDPRTMAPVLALGLQSYLTLESLLNVIDPTQPTLQHFLNDFRADLADSSAPACSSNAYTNFLYCMYGLAVNGIVKTDLPSEDEFLGYLWHITQLASVFAHPSTDPARPTSESWGARWPSTYELESQQVAFSGNGLAWNRVYGASETYPQYGFYGNAQVDHPKGNLFTPAYLMSVIDSSNAVSQWWNAGFLFNVWSDIYMSIDSLWS